MWELKSSKREFTLEEHQEGQGSHNWLKSQPFIMIGWDPWFKKSVDYLNCIEVGLNDIHCSTQNTALFVDLL